MKKLMLSIIAAALSFGVFAEGLEGVYSLKGTANIPGGNEVTSEFMMVVTKTSNGYEFVLTLEGTSSNQNRFTVNKVETSSDEVIFESEITDKNEQLKDGRFNQSTKDISFFMSSVFPATYKGKKGGYIDSSNMKKENAGSIVTLYPTLSPGYEIESLAVRYGDFDICLNDKYQFIKPAGDVEISATYRKIDGNDDDNDDGNEGDNPKPTDVNEVNVSAQSVVGEKFHTVLGQPLTEPQTSGVTVVTRTYSDGAVRSSKEVR